MGCSEICSYYNKVDKLKILYMYIINNNGGLYQRK